VRSPRRKYQSLDRKKSVGAFRFGELFVVAWCERRNAVIVRVTGC
jgi:hypothetical protein